MRVKEENEKAVLKHNIKKKKKKKKPWVGIEHLELLILGSSLETLFCNNTQHLHFQNIKQITLQSNLCQEVN